MEVKSVGNIKLPKIEDIQAFTNEVVCSLKDLNFHSKREIVRALVEKVIGNHDKLIISGYIPITNVNVITNHRYRWTSECGEVHII